MQKSVYDLDFNLTPVMSRGRVDWKFQCNECDLEKMLINHDGRLSYMQHVRAHDHYRGECPAWRIS